MKLFIDTGAFVARLDEKDDYYKAAVEVFESIARGELGYKRLYTSNYIINESVTHVLYRTKKHADALKMLEMVTKSRYLNLLWVTDEIHEKAVTTFRENPNLLLSLTDCTSAALMAENGIDAIFTFDDDFQKLGFKVVP